jgi:hypothetical protein
MGFNLIPNIEQVVGIESLKELDVPPDQILIDGSGVLALYGIRQNRDLDIAVPMRYWIEMLKNSQKYTLSFGGLSKVVMLVYKDIEIHYSDWDNITPVEETLKVTPLIGGFHFHTLETIYKWKKLANRKKDQADCKLIEEFWEFQKNQGNNLVKEKLSYLVKKVKNYNVSSLDEE